MQLKCNKMKLAGLRPQDSFLIRDRIPDLAEFYGTNSQVEFVNVLGGGQAVVQHIAGKSTIRYDVQPVL